MLALVLCFCVSIASAGQGQEPSGNVEVRAVVKDVEGNLSSVPYVHVQLRGSIVLDAETDEEGKCEFTAVRVGSYSIQATVSGFEGTAVLSVKAGKTEEVRIE